MGGFNAEALAASSDWKDREAFMSLDAEERARLAGTLGVLHYEGQRHDDAEWYLRVAIDA